VSSVKRVWKGGEGGELRWFWEDSAGQSRDNALAGPGPEARKVRSGDFLEPTKLSRLTYKATRQGWRSCLVLLGAK
jgi:hypothetical protein